MVVLLAVADLPFRRLSRGLKDILGYIALATLAVGTATWITAILTNPR
jgi:hypothetical protein